MTLLTTLFSRVPMFFYGGVTVYGYQQYFRQESLLDEHEQIFKNGFKCGINELLGDDYQKHATEAEINTHYESFNRKNI
jgi:hypothetical protein